MLLRGSGLRLERRDPTLLWSERCGFVKRLGEWPLVTRGRLVSVSWRDLNLCQGFHHSWCLCCRIPNIVEYLRDPLQAGLVDRSGYVRKTAVLGVVKLFYVAPEVVTGEHVGG